MIDIKKVIEEESYIRKYDGVAPEGFILIHEKTLEDLKNLEKWRDWKMGRVSINEMNKKNFNNS